MLPLVIIQWNWGDSNRLIIYSLIKEILNLVLGTHSWLLLQGSRITAFMTEFLHLFLSIEFITHRHCYLWRPGNELLQAEITERKRIEFALCAIGIANLAIDGRWLLVNHRLRYLVGYTEVVSI